MEPPPTPQVTGNPSFPTLELLDPSSKTSSLNFGKPSKRINEGQDVSTFLTTKAYRDIGIFVLQLNRAVCPRRQIPPEGGKETTQTFTLTSVQRADSQLPAPIKGLQKLLKEADSLIDDAPPDPGPRRFGNVSFRKWFSLLEERCGALMEEFIMSSVPYFNSGNGSGSGSGSGSGNDSQAEPQPDQGIRDELTAYFLGAFGSAQRLDYGTGHELSFLAFLGCLWKLRFFETEKAQTSLSSSSSPSSQTGATTLPSPGETERLILLAVMEPYLHVVRRLILTYTLEPAGSHGVWGLDDHSFLPYIFGSGQLTRPITEAEPMPVEGSVRGAPRTGDVVKPQAIEDYRGVNMYFSAIGFINDVKKGPFWEHSPILYDVSGIRDGWGKINKGMIKMFNAEVLSKFPVVQHFRFGALFSWDQDPGASAPAHSIHLANQAPMASAAPAPTPGQAPGASVGAGPGTAAPWAAATRMPSGTAASGPGIPYSRAPNLPSRAANTIQGQTLGRRPGGATSGGGGGSRHGASAEGRNPGPQTGVLGAGGNGGSGEAGEGGDKGAASTDPQVTTTKAPWAK